MAGYSDTRKMIIDALMGRPEGTQIQPEDHQAFALQIIDYIRSVELVAGNATPIGFADADTVPVQPYNGQAIYLSSVSGSNTITFTNFIDQNGNAISVTSTTNVIKLITLLWNGQYWSSQVTSVNAVCATDGYQFAGVATKDTNPNTPEAKVFYIADGKGVYTNFGGISVTEDEVVVLYYDTAWHKEVTGIASNQKLTELGQQVSGIRSDVDGQNQEIADFKATITNQVDNFQPIVINGNVTNAPDEEDITTDASNLLKFANRGTLHGMGYVILRKDKTFAEQVTKANTIYEVRYDFDIDTAFQMPENSRLFFAGGKVKIGNDVVISTNEVRASEIGMVQNNKAFAVKNALLLAYYSNLGMNIIIDGVYYINSESPISLTNDVIWNGDGTLIRASDGGVIFSINVPIKISIDGLTFDGDFDVDNNTRSLIFEVASILYSKGVYIKNCTIKKVRIYTHIGKDVDQQSTLDGDYEVVFENNTISDIANSVCRIDNCKCNLLKITNNIFRKIHNLIFQAGVDNSYQALPFGRLTNAIISNNYWDNSELIIENATSVYNCMIVLECEICTFTNNYIKDFIVHSGNSGCDTYTAYLSSRICEITNNTFINVVGFNNPDYSDIFKCKMGAGIGMGLSERKIENNTYILTKECVEKYGDINNPPVKTLCGLQSSIDRISISNNLIDAYCKFAFGGGANLEYKNYEFRNNRIVCHSLADSNLMRFKESTNNADIVIEGNEVLAESFSNINRTLFHNYIPSGYSINLKNNNFRGYELSLVNSTSIKEVIGKLSALDVNATLARHFAGLKEDIVFDTSSINKDTVIRLYGIKDSRYLFEPFGNIGALELMDMRTQYSEGSFLGTLITSVKYSNHFATAIVHIKENVIEVFDGQGNLKTINRPLSSIEDIPIKDKNEMNLYLLRANTNDFLLFFYSAKGNVEVRFKTIEGQYIFPNLVDEYLGTTLTGVDSMSQASKGIPMIYAGGLVFFDGIKAKTADGYSVAAKNGTDSQRPTNLDNTNDVGYVYFDSTLGKPIYWTGTKWIDATGADA